MAGYDPKRPRRVSDADDPAPVEALIDLADGRERAPRVSASSSESPSTSDFPGVSGRATPGSDSPGSASRSAAGHPGGTGSATSATRALVAVALVAAVVAAVVLLRRRRRS